MERAFSHKLFVREEGSFFNICGQLAIILHDCNHPLVIRRSIIDSENLIIF